jgi:hypothetical protein
MTLRQYLAIMVIATGLSWLAWALVIINVDPFETSVMGFVFFYVSFFLAALGTVSMARFGWLHWFSRSDAPMFRFVERSFRDAVIAGAILTVLLYLRGTGLLRVWNFALFVLFVGAYLLFHYSLARDHRSASGDTQTSV